MIALDIEPPPLTALAPGQLSTQVCFKFSRDASTSNRSASVNRVF
jgi:hypothetical protein